MCRYDVNDVMSGKDARIFPPRTILAEARAQNNRECHGAEAARGMDDSGSREIDITVAKIQGGTELREPPSSPSPTAGDRIKNRADEQFTKQERPRR
jgi:hypothetical protein